MLTWKPWCSSGVTVRNRGIPKMATLVRKWCSVPWDLVYSCVFPMFPGFKSHAPGRNQKTKFRKNPGNEGNCNNPRHFDMILPCSSGPIWFFAECFLWAMGSKQQTSSLSVLHMVISNCRNPEMSAGQKIFEWRQELKNRQCLKVGDIEIQKWQKDWC